MSLDYLVTLRIGGALAAARAVDAVKKSLKEVSTVAALASLYLKQVASNQITADLKKKGTLVNLLGKELHAGAFGAKALAGAFAGVALAAGAAAIKIGATLLEASAFRERSIGRFTALLGDKKKADEEFLDAVKIAERSPYDPDQVVNSLAKLSTSFKDDTTRREIFGAISDFTTVTAGGNEGLKNITKAITDVAGKGQLEMEELKGQLGDAGLGVNVVLPKIAALLGIQGRTEEERLKKVRKAIKDGKVSGEVGVFAIYQAMKEVAGGGPAGSATEKASGTIDGLISNIKGGMKTLFGMMDTTKWAGIVALKGLLSDVANLFRSDSKEGAGLTAGIRRLSDVAAPIFGLLRQDLGNMKALLSGNAAESQGFYDGLTGILYAVYGIAKAFAYATYGVVQFFGWLSSLGERLGDTAFEVVQWGARMYEAGANLVDGLIEGIKAALGRLRDTVTGMGTDTVRWLKEALKISSPSREMAAIGGWAAEGFAQGMERSSAPRDSAGQLAGEALGGAARGAGGGLGGAGGISVEVNLVLPGGGAGADPQAVAAALLPQVGAAARDAVEQALARWAQGA